MAHGYPDYSQPVPEVLVEQDYEDWLLWAWGNVAAGAWVGIDVYTVPAGYEVIQSFSVVSAKGTDFCHGLEIFIAGALRHTDYFGDDLAIAYPRYVKATAGQVVRIVLYNYDAVLRSFLWSSLGIRMAVGTTPPPYQRDPGPPPGLKKGETLFFIEDNVTGKRWVKGRQYPVKEPLDAVLDYIERTKGG